MIEEALSSFRQVSVIDPFLVTSKMAETLATLSLKHSSPRYIEIHQK